MQLRVLNSEISNMKRQKVDLVKKMQEERKRYEEEAKMRRREIMNLKRIQQRDKQQILRLGSQKDAQERVLKRKMEEVTAAKLRLKHQQQLTAQAKKINRKKSPGSIRADGDAKWLSEEVKKRAEEQQKLEQLQKERESVAKEMEALYAQRKKLEMEIKNPTSSQTNIRNMLITSPLQSSTLSLRNSGQQLTPTEEQLLFDLEERIEACQAQLEYKEEKISEIADDVRMVDESNAFEQIETTQSLAEARTLLKMLFSMAVDVKKQDQQKEQKLARQQVEMADLVRHLEQEREKTMLMKRNFEESLQRLTSGRTSSKDSSSVHESLDERGRVLLSVSEERNAVLRKRCEELEKTCLSRDQDKLLMEDRLQQEQLDLAASRERIQYLETKLKKLSAVAVGASQKQERLRIPLSSSIQNNFSAVIPRTDLGPTSWANELNDDDDMATDENDDEHELEGNENAPMPSDNDDNAPVSRSFGQVKMELANMGGSKAELPSTLPEKRSVQLRNGSEEYVFHGDEGEADVTSLHIGSDDSSTAPKSIFSRLSNPTNFTGIHKNRVRESASKREILQSRSERNRSRRLKDKGQVKLSRISNALSEQLGGTHAGYKNPPAVKSNTVLEVLANMKRENESEQYVTNSSGLRQSMFHVTTDRARDNSSDNTKLAVSSSSAFNTMPPLPPQSDVYSRLAGQYTVSAKSKRQHTTTPAHREKGDGMEGSEKARLDGIDHENVADIVDEPRGKENANYTGSEDESSYDPLIGGDSLFKQVHNDYRERIAQRNAEAGN
ncbi:hypothetical protein PsorP6_018836 [Peronosclerospora sorghi]|nr:hypothetical protein PsorP6_018836 [Peronosclerospora sorghi]